MFPLLRVLSELLVSNTAGSPTGDFLSASLRFRNPSQISAVMMSFQFPFNSSPFAINSTV